MKPFIAPLQSPADAPWLQVVALCTKTVKNRRCFFYVSVINSRLPTICASKLCLNGQKRLKPPLARLFLHAAFLPFFTKNIVKQMPNIAIVIC